MTARNGTCDRCSAPLCPLDEQSVERGVWYPSEPICVRHGQREKWLRVQKRLARRLAGVPDSGLFSVRMLEGLGAVGAATRGLSPDIADTDWPAAEAAWCAKRKPRTPRVVTEAQREAGRTALFNWRKRQTRVDATTSGGACGSGAKAAVASPEEPLNGPSDAAEERTR